MGVLDSCHWIRVSCGEGFIDVLDAKTYQRVVRIATVVGARTALFVPELNRLFVAVRKTATESAAIWVYQLPQLQQLGNSDIDR